MSFFTVSQLNLRKAIAPTASFLTALSPNSIGLIQEPYCAKPFRKVSYVPPSHISFKAPGTFPRAAIVVPVALGPSCFPLLNFSNRDCVALRISSPSSPDFIICSYYMDITLNNPPLCHPFTALVEHCNSNNIPLITGMDSNAHHTAWYNRTNNRRGISLLDFFNVNSLQWANNSPKPTFQSRVGSSHIDLTLYNNNAAHHPQ